MRLMTQLSAGRYMSVANLHSIIGANGAGTPLPTSALKLFQSIDRRLSSLVLTGALLAIG
jgi:hypothetical protein